MFRKIFSLTFIVGLTAVAVAFAARPSHTAPGLATISNPGKPVAFTAGSPTARGTIVERRQLGEQGGLAYFRASRGAQADCFGVGDHVNGKIRVLQMTCPDGGPFPSVDRPLLDFTIVEVRGQAPKTAIVIGVDGFAADGVAWVALIDRTGREVSRTAVVGNVFRLAGAGGTVARGSELVALNGGGDKVWSRSL